MRLVDLDAVIDRIEVEWGYEGIREDLYSLPVVDAVQVVRCKDCKHYRNHPNGLCYLHTEPKANERGYSGEAVCVEQNDFCSYGKPKEDDKCDMVWI